MRSACKACLTANLMWGSMCECVHVCVVCACECVHACECVWCVHVCVHVCVSGGGGVVRRNQTKHPPNW